MSEIGMDQRQLDALANMMGADGRRIDVLTNDVGHIKGKVESIDQGVGELRNAVMVLVRHEVKMEEHAGTISVVRAELAAQSQRVAAIEVEMPQLRETRLWVVRAMLLVLGLVGVAVVGLVIIRT